VTQFTVGWPMLQSPRNRPSGPLMRWTRARSRCVAKTRGKIGVAIGVCRDLFPRPPELVRPLAAEQHPVRPQASAVNLLKMTGLRSILRLFQKRR
jgi:hypothetical protein